MSRANVDVLGERLIVAVASRLREFSLDSPLRFSYEFESNGSFRYLNGKVALEFQLWGYNPTFLLLHRLSYSPPELGC